MRKEHRYLIFEVNVDCSRKEQKIYILDKISSYRRQLYGDLGEMYNIVKSKIYSSIGKSYILIQISGKHQNPFINIIKVLNERSNDIDMKWIHTNTRYKLAVRKMIKLIQKDIKAEEDLISSQEID